MPVKNYKPTSPGIRFQSHHTFDELTKTKPEKSLTKGKMKTGGRSSTGRVSSRFIGGGHKQKYRDIDFKRDKHGIPAKVAAIEYDPNRTARIALLHYADGEKRYILAPDGLNVGSTITSGPSSGPVTGGSSLSLAVSRLSSSMVSGGSVREIDCARPCQPTGSAVTSPYGVPTLLPP